MNDWNFYLPIGNDLYSMLFSTSDNQGWSGWYSISYTLYLKIMLSVLQKAANKELKGSYACAHVYVSVY